MAIAEGVMDASVGHSQTLAERPLKLAAAAH